jgi:FMN phosphatase YigB (HAD superfamily)
MKVQPTELTVFDLDGTLYESKPGPPEDPTWWYSAQSLSGHGPPGFDPRWRLGVVLLARRVVTAPWTRTALLTGRPRHNEMERVIRQMLHEADLDFDHVQLKPVTVDVPTSAYKAAAVRKWILADPTISKVTLHDDEPENIEAVRSVVLELKRLYVPVLHRS